MKQVKLDLMQRLRIVEVKRDGRKLDTIVELKAGYSGCADENAFGHFQLLRQDENIDVVARVARQVFVIAKDEELHAYRTPVREHRRDQGAQVAIAWL